MDSNLPPGVSLSQPGGPDDPERVALEQLLDELAVGTESADDLRMLLSLGRGVTEAVDALAQERTRDLQAQVVELEEMLANAERDTKELRRTAAQSIGKNLMENNVANAAQRFLDIVKAGGKDEEELAAIKGLAKAVRLFREGEPVFVLRAQDKLAPHVVRYWCQLLFASCEGQQAPDQIMRKRDLALDTCEAMEEWQAEHGSKLPD